MLDSKRSIFIPIPKKGNAKEYSNYCTIALISHASKVMLKILQACLQQDVSCELPDVQAGFRKCRGTRDQIANILWITEKAREFQKNICFIEKVVTNSTLKSEDITLPTKAHLVKAMVFPAVVYGCES